MSTASVVAFCATVRNRLSLWLLAVSACKHDKMLLVVAVLLSNDSLAILRCHWPFRYNSDDSRLFPTIQVIISYRPWFNISLFHNKGSKANRHLIEQENAPIFLTVRAHDQGLSELEYYLPGFWCADHKFIWWTAPDHYSPHHIQPLVRFKFASQQRQ